MSSNSSHEHTSGQALSLPGKKKSHETSWQKAKRYEAELRRKRRRATAHAELAKDMRELQMELKNSRKRPSLLSAIRKFFASF